MKETLTPIQKIFFYLLLVLAMVSWGFAWPSGKAVVDYATPKVIVFWRFLITAVSLVPIVLLTRKSFSIKSPRTLFLVFVGAIFYTIYNQSFFFGLQKGFPGAAGVLVTTLNPLITYFLVSMIHKQKLNYRSMIGLGIGFVGGMFLLQIWNISLDQLLSSGNLFFLICSISWAFLSLNSQETGKILPTVTYSFYVFAIGTVLTGLLSQDQDLLSVFPGDFKLWGNLFYMAIISTSFGTTMYFYASIYLGSQVASSFIFMVPVSALLSSLFLFDEIPSLYTIVGGLLALIAVYTINSGKSISKPSSPQ